MKKKIIILLFIFSFFLTALSVYPSSSTEDYTSFTEVIMNEGKLLSNFTSKEYDELYKKTGKRKMFGYSVFVENDNVDASYISNTLYSIENDSDSDITYQIDVVVETNNKTTFKASGGLNGKVSGKKGENIKAEIGGECGIDYSTSNSESRTETQKLDVVVEAHSRCVIYLTGDLSVTNGVVKYYYFWIEVYRGGFEIVTLKNQYTRIEKAKI
jgi:hypothetical protein